MTIHLLQIDYVKDYEMQNKNASGWWFADECNSRGERVVLFACPFCQVPGKLNADGGNHTIAHDGTVNPAISCSCGKFNAYIKLSDYQKYNEK